MLIRPTWKTRRGKLDYLLALWGRYRLYFYLFSPEMAICLVFMTLALKHFWPTLSTFELLLLGQCVYWFMIASAQLVVDKVLRLLEQEPEDAPPKPPVKPDIDPQTGTNVYYIRRRPR